MDVHSILGRQDVDILSQVCTVGEGRLWKSVECRVLDGEKEVGSRFDDERTKHRATPYALWRM